MITLALDAATYVGTVAIVDDDRVLAERETAMRGRDVERLMPAVAEALHDAGISIGAIARIVCGEGPGSFTSLRIAASIAKGIAMGRDCPLFAVSSLALIVAAPPDLAAGAYIATLDALRDEVYVGAFERRTDGRVTHRGPVRLVPIGAVADVASAIGACVIGPGRNLDAHPHARGIVALRDILKAAKPVDLASWEPSYGRLPEAQARWEAAHGRPLTTS